jgi:hypothetical protein
LFFFPALQDSLDTFLLQIALNFQAFQHGSGRGIFLLKT